MNLRGANVKVIWSVTEWAQAVCDLPADGPLPARTVLVPRERVAHSLRRELIRAGRSDVLAGTRFIRPADAADQTLRHAGVTFSTGEEALRPLRLLTLFDQGLSLRYFRQCFLQTRPGWEDAFARTISDLEAAGLRPEDLPVSEDDRWADVAAVWRALNDAAGDSWTSARVLMTAGALLEQSPRAWPFDGNTLAVVTGETTVAESCFLKATPGLTLGALGARPLREHYLERLAELFGEACRQAVSTAVASRGSSTERDLLAAYLFEPPDVLNHPRKPRSKGPDDTVRLEEFGGVEAELEAAADWVAQQIVEHHTPLEEIAVLMPVLDPLALLLAQRLERLPWQDGSLPVHVAGGLPVTGTAAGARLLAVVRALRAHLSVDLVAEVLPLLRTTGDSSHLSRHAATNLAYWLGTLGGAATHKEGGLEWTSGAVDRENDLAAQIAAAAVATDGGAAGPPDRDFGSRERLLRELQSVRPALDALVDVYRAVLAGEPLAKLASPLLGYLKEWILLPGDGAQHLARLAAAIEGLCRDANGGSLAGEEALAVVEDVLLGLRISSGRFGEPAVYVGTLRDAMGLRFHAVRVIGLAEGSLPSMPREDPVLPESLRRRLGRRLPTPADRSLAELHALDRAVRHADANVALSAARLGVDRVEREVSSVFTEAAAALGRPDASTGKHSDVIPNLDALRRNAFRPAREAAANFRLQTPIAETAWQDRAAAGVAAPLARWMDGNLFPLDKLRALLPAIGGAPIEGMFGAADRGPVVPGTVAERPISASRLKILMACPRRFLFESLFYWHEPAAAPPLREIDPMSYGSLFHKVAEKFFAQSGKAFGDREGRLSDWQRQGRARADQVFAEFTRWYPLAGDTVREQQRERLRRDVRILLEYDWDPKMPRTFVAVERPFGEDVPVELSVGGAPLYVRGYIDRLDIDQGTTLVRDLKTSRPRPRKGNEFEPDHRQDVQLGLYGLVVQRLARDWQLPERVAAAYVYPDLHGDRERAFRSDFHLLQSHAETWLGIAARLLHGRFFPPTLDAKDCEYCPFRPVCGADVTERAQDSLAGADGVLAEFRSLKLADLAS